MPNTSRPTLVLWITIDRMIRPHNVFALTHAFLLTPRGKSIKHVTVLDRSNWSLFCSSEMWAQDCLKMHPCINRYPSTEYWPCTKKLNSGRMDPDWQNWRPWSAKSPLAHQNSSEAKASWNVPWRRGDSLEYFPEGNTWSKTSQSTFIHASQRSQIPSDWMFSFQIVTSVKQCDELRFRSKCSTFCLALVWMWISSTGRHG